MTQDAKCVAIFVDFCKAFDSVSWIQITAILYAYGVPAELVLAIVSIYNGAKAGLRDVDDQVSDESSFSLSVGVLQGDTLAPYIFIIVMDFVLLWKDHVKNIDLYKTLPRISTRLQQRRMVFAGHC
jgi:hypothetical protein